MIGQCWHVGTLRHFAAGAAECRRDDGIISITALERIAILGAGEEMHVSNSTKLALIAIGYVLSFRQRPLCSRTVIQALEPAGLDHWNSGSLYNPEDGQTYRVSAELRSADVFVAWIYLGVPLFGETKTLLRVSRLRSEGWC